MRRAWAIYKGRNPYSGIFSLSLSRAWEIEKANRAYYSPEKVAEREAAEKAIRNSGFGGHIWDDKDPETVKFIKACYEQDERRAK